MTVVNNGINVLTVLLSFPVFKSAKYIFFSDQEVFPKEINPEENDSLQEKNFELFYMYYTIQPQTVVHV